MSQYDTQLATVPLYIDREEAEGLHVLVTLDVIPGEPPAAWSPGCDPEPEAQVTAEVIEALGPYAVGQTVELTIEECREAEADFLKR